jgi:hypothetical protein
MTMLTDGQLQDCETAAYYCDGEADDRFERHVVPALAQFSAAKVAALAAFFLDRRMDDYARFLAGYARAMWWQKQKARAPQAAWRDWLAEQARMHEADVLEPIPF